jgi:pimeloyl-ACP methyl ester carboxylesterase
MSIFDSKVRRPSRALLLLESRALLEIGYYFQARPVLRRVVPPGDGHPVLIIPGFLAGDGSTNPLRSFLWDRHYAAHRWELGRNLIFSTERMAQIQARVHELKCHYGVKVSLIGWSLGGLYAREIARAQPDAIRLVITLGSPFARNLKANNAHWLYRLVSGQRAENLGPQLIRRMQEPPPVPTTAIYSRTDGIVAWQCCMEQREGPLTENVRVRGSHCGLGHNPLALFVIGDRLAQPEGRWSRFERTGFKKLLYPQPDRQRKAARV